MTVCRRWRSVLLEVRKIWSIIDESCASFVPLLLTRSGRHTALQLKWTVRTSDRISVKKRSPLQRVLKHVHRFESIDVCLPYTECLSILSLIVLEKRPTLHTLRLSTDDKRPYLPLPFSLEALRKFPALRSLALTGFHLEFKFQNPVLPGTQLITSLSLVYSNIRTAPEELLEIQEAIRLLGNFTHLTYLHLESGHQFSRSTKSFSVLDTLDEEKDRLSLPHLSDLCINNFDHMSHVYHLPWVLKIPKSCVVQLMLPDPRECDDDSDEEGSLDPFLQYRSSRIHNILPWSQLHIRALHLCRNGKQYNMRIRLTDPSPFTKLHIYQSADIYFNSDLNRKLFVHSSFRTLLAYFGLFSDHTNATLSACCCAVPDMINLFLLERFVFGFEEEPSIGPDLFPDLGELKIDFSTWGSLLSAVPSAASTICMLREAMDFRGQFGVWPPSIAIHEFPSNEAERTAALKEVAEMDAGLVTVGMTEERTLFDGDSELWYTSPPS